jgi:hypothetical protein
MAYRIASCRRDEGTRAHVFYVLDDAIPTIVQEFATRKKAIAWVVANTCKHSPQWDTAFVGNRDSHDSVFVGEDRPKCQMRQGRHVRSHKH